MLQHADTVVVVTDGRTIKLQGEISSDCPERNLVTAAGRERKIRVAGWTPGVYPSGPEPMGQAGGFVSCVYITICKYIVQGRGHKTLRYMAR